MANILIVDDEVTVCNFLEQFLKSQGYSFHSVYSGKQALAAIKDDTYDLILLDILMPEMDGIEMLKCLTKAGYKIPIIALSGVKEEKILNEVVESGIVDFIPKPIDLDALEQSILVHLP